MPRKDYAAARLRNEQLETACGIEHRETPRGKARRTHPLFGARCFKDRRPLSACPLRRGCRARICFRMANFLKSRHASVGDCVVRARRRPHGRDTSVGAYGHDLGRPRAEPATSESRQCGSTSDGRPSHSSIETSTNSTSSKCQLQPELTPVPRTMRPFGMRAEPPAWAARAASICSSPTSSARNVSSATRNVTTALLLRAVGPCQQPAVKSGNSAVAHNARHRCLARVAGAEFMIRPFRPG
jgi:hypothetical protein